MFEYLEIDSDKWRFPLHVRIWNNSTLQYKILDVESESADVIDINYNYADFCRSLEEFNISSWKKKYMPPRNVRVLDGGSWSVKYKKTEENVIVRTGENAWPPNWHEFISFIKSVIED